MRSEQYVKQINIPEFRDVIYKLLQFIKVDNYNIGFKNGYKSCEFMLISEKDPNVVYSLGDIEAHINSVLEEENKRKDRLDYTRAFSIIQDIVDEYVYKIQDITNCKEVFFAAKKLKFLYFVRSLIGLLIKLENSRYPKNIRIEDDSIKIEGKVVFTFQHDFLCTTSPLRILYMELLEPLSEIF